MKEQKTFVYLCRPGENEELRYSLRSVNAFYPDAEVWVVGGKPDWYIGNFIEVAQSRNSFTNINTALRKVVSSPNIPDEIIIMNDDFFFVREVPKIESYISGTLEKRILFNRKNGNNSSYIKMLERSYRYCKRFRNPPLDFDIHVPMQINKVNLSLILDDPILWRSNYGNRFIDDADVVTIEDVKVYPGKDNGFRSYDYSNLKYPFVSTQDSSFEEVLNSLFIDMFPNRSAYESMT